MSQQLTQPRKRRIRTSPQEKYEFLMGLIECSEEERKQASMKSGLTFDEVRHSLQVDYNRGQLRLSTEQIANLKRNGFLNYSREEKERITEGITEEIKLPRKYLPHIIKKYGSYEEFIQQYKSGAIDYKFGKDVFCGYRGITVSEQEMTVEQKLRYVDFVNDLFEGVNLNFNDGDYIDLDVLEKIIDSMSDKRKYCVRQYYGLNGQKKTYMAIGKELGISKDSVRELINRGMTEARIFQTRKNNPICNLNTEFNQHQQSIERQEKAIQSLETIKSYICDKSGKPKEDVEDTRLEKLGIRRLPIYNKIIRGK